LCEIFIKLKNMFLVHIHVNNKWEDVWRFSGIVFISSFETLGFGPLTSFQYVLTSHLFFSSSNSPSDTLAHVNTHRQIEDSALN
jgi:hypothetical protein